MALLAALTIALLVRGFSGARPLVQRKREGGSLVGLCEVIGGVIVPAS
jgi:hypothetical protein